MDIKQVIRFFLEFNLLDGSSQIQEYYWNMGLANMAYDLANKYGITLPNLYKNLPKILG